jgi:hypothetical protein
VFATVYGGGAYVSHDDGATWDVLDPQFARIPYSYLALPVASDATGQWIYEGSQGAGIFQIEPVRIDAVPSPSAKKVKGGNR